MRRGAAPALISAALAGIVLALGARVVLTAPDTALPWSAFAGGGSSSSANYQLGATVGQIAAGQATGSSYRFGAGFWSADLDGDGLLVGADNCPTAANPGQQNTDGDAAGDACDPCPTIANAFPIPWMVGPGDGDCDGFTDGEEGTIGTDAADPCANTAAAGDEADDRWPSDFDDSQVINISDLFEVLPPYFGTAVPPTSARRDLAPDGVINISDVFKVLPPYFGASCT